MERLLGEVGAGVEAIVAEARASGPKKMRLKAMVLAEEDGRGQAVGIARRPVDNRLATAEAS
jgi:hypothetical protein